MIVNAFLLGACFYMHAFFFVTAYLRRTDAAPYREAFAWLCLVCTLQCLLQLLFYVIPGMEYLNSRMIIVTRDALAVPFILMEIHTLCNQNVKLMPWRKRWTTLAVSEIPFLFFFFFSLYTEYTYFEYVMAAYVVPYIIISAILLYKEMREYNRVLSFTTDTRKRSVTWVAWLFGVNLLILVLYSVMCPFFDSNVVQSVYVLANIILITTNAYFIYNQRPEDAHEMARIRNVLHTENDLIKTELQKKIKEVELQKEELSEKVNHINDLSNEMTENAEKLKRKANIKEYMHAATLQHPQFEKKLNRLAGGRLTSHDMLICMLIYDGKKVSHIASMVGVNTRSAEMARSRIRKKLNLAPTDNLYRVIKNTVES